MGDGPDRRARVMARRTTTRTYHGANIYPPNFAGMWTSYVGDRFYAADTLDGIKRIIRRVVTRGDDGNVSSSGRVPCKGDDLGMFPGNRVQSVLPGRCGGNPAR